MLCISMFVCQPALISKYHLLMRWWFRCINAIFDY